MKLAVVGTGMIVDLLGARLSAGIAFPADEA